MACYAQYTWTPFFAKGGNCFFTFEKTRKGWLFQRSTFANFCNKLGPKKEHLTKTIFLLNLLYMQDNYTYLIQKYHQHSIWFMTSIVTFPKKIIYLNFTIFLANFYGIFHSSPLWIVQMPNCPRHSLQSNTNQT